MQFDQVHGLVLKKLYVSEPFDLYFSMQFVVVGTKRASTNISTFELSIVLIRGLVIFSLLAEWLRYF